MPPMEAEKKTGICQLCGAENRELYFSFIGDYLGWTCLECIHQIKGSQQRKYTATGEESEPAE